MTRPPVPGMMRFAAGVNTWRVAAARKERQTMNGRLKADTRGTMSADRTPQVRPRWYRFALTTHIVLAVGALGVEAAVLFLTLTGLSSSAADLVKAAYLVLDRIAPYLLVPLAIAAVLRGLAMATPGGWGPHPSCWVQ